MTPVPIRFRNIIMKFYSDDHKPIHVHCIHAEYGYRVEIRKTNGVPHFDFFNIGGMRHFSPSTQKEIRKVIKKHHKKITDDWKDFFVEGKKIKTLVINTI